MLSGYTVLERIIYFVSSMEVISYLIPLYGFIANVYSRL
jgi:hypothetical protein